MWNVRRLHFVHRIMCRLNKRFIVERMSAYLRVWNMEISMHELKYFLRFCNAAQQWWWQRNRSECSEMEIMI